MGKKWNFQYLIAEKLNATLKDPRNPDRIPHRQIDMLRQRIYGLVLGYEDLNDHDHLRRDLVWQTAVERDQELASSPTLCRLEGRAERATAWEMHKVMVEEFIASFKEAPEELILDFDATDDRVHGKQEGRAFHGYYGDGCFLSLYVFCEDQLLVSYLRPGNKDSARHSWAILKLLVNRLREAFASVCIIIRADSGFCRWKMLRWCEKNKVSYIVGPGKNKRLTTLVEEPLKNAAQNFETTKEKQRLFGWIDYDAKSWDKERRVIYKSEHAEKGSNPRFVITNLEGDPQQLHDNIYCARGEMENRIKEQQLGLFSDRTSCKKW